MRPVDVRVQSVHPTHRSLSVIADREDIARQDVPFSENFVNSHLHCISNIPQYIIDDLNGTNSQDCSTSQRVHQLDEQRILENNGKLFKSKKRINSTDQAISEGYKIALFDDGLQDMSLNYDLEFVCFNNISWIGNGLTIPSGPLRENLQKLKKYNNVFLTGNGENTENIKNYILNIDPNINIYEAKYIPLNINEFEKKEKYLVFSGIGNHKTFISMLKINGLNMHYTT